MEIIVVDDSGVLATWEKICDLQVHRQDSVSCVRLGKNVGQHAALIAGTRFCRFQFTVTIDDDLQHDPREIPRLAATLESGFDIVYGYPLSSKHKKWRRAGSWFVRRIHTLLLGNSVAKHSSSFRIFRTQLRGAFLTLRGPQVNVDAALAWATSNFEAIPVPHNSRAEGKSSYNLRRLFSTSKSSVTAFSTRPLRVIAALGFLIACLGAALFAWSLYLGLSQSEGVPGFAFLASALSLYSGVQLVSLGVIGEYVGQLHLRSMDVPTFFVIDSELAGHGLPEAP